METPSSKRIVLPLLRGAAAFAIFFFVRAFILFQTLNIATAKDTQIFADFPLFAIGLIVMLGSLFLYNSILRHLLLYSADELESFIENPEVGGRLAEYLRIIRGREFLLGTAASVIPLMLFIPFGGLYEAELLFAALGSRRYLAIYAVYLAAFLFSGVNARYETRRHWHQLIERRELDMLKSRLRFALRLALILIIYPVAIPLSPILVFTAINLFTVVRAGLGLFSTVGLLIAAATILFLVFAMPKLRAHRHRRAFLRRLRPICEDAGFEILDLRPERSLRLGLAGGLTFSLRRGESLYSCRLMVVEHRRLPLYFTADGKCHYLLRLGGKKHFVSLARHFEYGFTSEGKRILILTPEPKRAFLSSDGGERRLFTGDRAWSATVFEPDAFLGAVDRNCLDRSSRSYD